MIFIQLLVGLLGYLFLSGFVSGFYDAGEGKSDTNSTEFILTLVMWPALGIFLILELTYILGQAVHKKFRGGKRV